MGKRGDRHLPLLIGHRDELRLAQRDRIMARSPRPLPRLLSTHPWPGPNHGSWGASGG